MATLSNAKYGDDFFFDRIQIYITVTFCLCIYQTPSGSDYCDLKYSCHDEDDDEDDDENLDGDLLPTRRRSWQ